jgi:hypothetical protein
MWAYFSDSDLCERGVIYFLNFILQYGPMKSHQYFGYEGILQSCR